MFAFNIRKKRFLSFPRGWVDSFLISGASLPALETADVATFERYSGTSPLRLLDGVSCEKIRARKGLSLVNDALLTLQIHEYTICLSMSSHCCVVKHLRHVWTHNLMSHFFLLLRFIKKKLNSKFVMRSFFSKIVSVCTLYYFKLLIIWFGGSGELKWHQNSSTSFKLLYVSHLEKKCEPCVFFLHK